MTPLPLGLRTTFLIFVFLACGLIARATTGNAIDRIDFGNVTSEAVHNFEPGIAPANLPLQGTGAYNQTYRQPVGNGTSVGTGSQALVFTMGCDPNRQNYMTVKLWGNDASAQIIFNNAGYENMQDAGTTAIYPNRFYYFTMQIPIAWTTGQKSVQLTIYMNGLGQGAIGQPVYSAFTHTAPAFVPDSTDVVGTAPVRTGQATLNTLTAAQAVGTTTTPGTLLANRQSLFTANTGYIDAIIARQVPATAIASGAPKEVVGLDLFSTYTSWQSANPGATADQWRNKIANTKAGPGYTAFPDELLGVLCTAYLLTPFVDANGNTVAGLDRYHNATLVAKMVAAMDGSSYEQDSDGGLIQQGSEWTGLTSTARTTGNYIGSTARQSTVHGGGDLQGCDTYGLGWTICKLLDDPAMPASTGTASPTNFVDYLGGSFDADLNGGSMLRAYAYERTLFNMINFYTLGTGGTESQHIFQMTALYASYVALQKLQALFPNSSYVPGPTTYDSGNWFGTASPTDGARMVLGLIPDTLRSTRYPSTGASINYGVTTKGLGESDGTMSCGFDGGGYGQILSWLAPRLAQMAAWDPTATAADRASFSAGANSIHNGFEPFISPLDKATVTNGVVTADTFSFSNETFITYRDTKNLNSSAGGFNFNTQYLTSDPNGALQNPYALRAAYLATQYNVLPSNGAGDGPALNYLRDVPAYESTVRSLIGVNPSTLTPLPGEPGQPDFAWADVQCGAVAFMNHGERFYMNANWRNTIPSVSNVARIHYTTGGIERGAQIVLPYNSATVQSDGNLSGTVYASPWAVRYGDYLIALNHTTAAQSTTLPVGYGQAKDLISGNYYNLGTTVSVAANSSAIFWLAASNTLATGATAPTLATAAAASSTVVSGTTVNLSVLGAANNNDAESNLTYTWSLAGNPPNPATFSANGTNAAKNTTATFSAPGTYNFAVLVTDPSNGLTIPSNVTVTVNQTLTSLAISPTTVSLVNGQTQQFVGTGNDQFGLPMQSALPITCSLASGVGSVNTFGLYSAPATGPGGSANITVTSGALSATAAVTVFAPVGNLGGTLAIGSAAVPGTASYSSGTYTVSSQSGDVWNASDQFRYVFQPITGDATITARVVTETNTSAWAKAGVMFRNTLDANSQYAFAMVTPTTTNGLSYQYRSTTSGNAANTITAGGVTVPYWLRIVRSGATFTAYRSPDGATWSLLGTAQTIAMNTTVYVGLAVTSNNTGALDTATFDNVSIIQPTNVFFTKDQDMGGPSPTGTYAETGTVTTASGTSTLSGTATMITGGSDVWGNADSCHFAYLPITGNATLTARVVSATASSKAGVMVRNTMAAGGAEASMLLLSGSGVHFERRTALNGATVETNVTATTTPYWVRLVRSGNSFSGYYSADGLNWTQDSTAQTVTMNSTVYAGLVTASRVANTAATAIYDNISLTATNDVAPTLATAASAGTVSGNTVALSVLGTDADGGGESNLTYAWSLLGQPAASATFSANGTNAAKNTTVTFNASGTYYFQVTVTDAGNLSATSAIVPVTVNLVPAAPTGFGALAGNNQVGLSWTASTYATGYNVKRSTTSGGPYTTVASPTGASYTDTGLTSGTPYYYVVTALSNSGESAPSSEAGATPTSPPPGWVTGVTATVNDGLVTLTWNAAPGAASYNVGRSTTNGGPYTIVASGVTANGYSDTTVTDGTTYYYIVTAANSGGTGTSSTAYGTTPVAPPAMPSGLAATPGDAQATLQWTAVPNAVSYNIKRATVSGGPYTTIDTSTTPSYINIGLANDTTYYYVISAVNAAAESANSAEVNVQPMNRPLNLAASPGNAQVTLTWTASYGSPLSYNVYRSTTNGSGYASIATGQTTAGYTDSGLTNGTTYYYVVTATYSYGEGSPSTQASARPLPPIPVAPTGFAAVGGTGQIALNWTAVTYATVYNVYRATASGGPYGAAIASPTGTNYADATAASGVTYYYVVTATDLAGEGVVSSEVNATILPGAVAGATASAGNGQVALNWTATPGAATYTIGRSTVSGGPYTTIASGGASTGYVDGGVANGVTYYYVITGVNAAGNGPTSTAIGAEPLPPIAAAPTGFAAVAGNAQVSLNWNTATYATSYNVKRSTTAGGPYTTVASPNGINVVDTGLTNGTTYYYVVTAVDLAGESGNSVEVNAQPLPPIAAAPTGIAAVAGNAQVSLNWNAATYATSYTVKRSTTAGGPYTTVASPISTSAIDTGLTNGTTYYYVVTAVDLAGESANSTEANAKPLPPIAAAPTSFAAVAGNSQVSLNWNAATYATSYNVKRSTTAGGPYTTVASPVSTSAIDTGLTNGTTYYYVVTTIDLAGESGNSTEVNAQPTSPLPSIVTGLAAVANSDQVTLSWTAATGATSYTIGRAIVSGGPYTTVASGVTAIGYTDASLVNGTTYYYVVAAVNASGTGPNSAQTLATPAAQNLFWDVTTAAGLANGSGTWDTATTAKWSNSSAGTSNPLLTWLYDDNAFFQTAGTFTATIASGTTIKLGSLTQALAGTLATVTGGTLQFNSNAGIVNATGGNHSLIINSALTLNSPNVTLDNEVTVGSLALNGVISETGGSRALTKNGAGTVSLGTSANTFSGGFTLNSAGQVAFSNNASFGTGAITFNAGTSLTSTAQIYTASTTSAGTLANNLVVTPGSFGAYTGNHTMLLSGGITGSGTFLISPAAAAVSVTLSGDNHAFAGTVVYNDNGASMLLLNSTGSGSANAIWTLTGGSTKGLGANIAGANTFPLGELSSASAIGRLFNNQATGTATFLIGDATAKTPSFGGILADGTAGGKVALIKTGTDNQILTGASTYTGATSINGGTLTVNGSLAAGSTVTVNAGAILAGTGKINGAATLASGGILSPGGNGTAGTLNFAGAFNLGSGGVLNYDLATTTTSDKIALTGTYAASGTVTINLTALSGFGAGTYSLITGATGISASNFALGATPPGHTYQLSSSGATLSLIVGNAPAAPTGLAAVAANTEVDLAWSASTGATSYSVLRGTTSGGPYTAVASGLIVTNYADKGLTNGTAYYYVVTATNAAGTSANSTQASATPTQTTIDSYWLDNDIGTVGQAGSSSYSSGTFTLNGSGTGVTGTADSLDYTYQTLTGDGTIIARVATGSGASGVMMRETLSASARTVDMLLQTGVGAVFQNRIATGGNAVNGATTASLAAPYWVKLARVGNIFTGSTSPDGVTWTQVGTVTDTMASTIYVGLAQSSLSNSALVAATFTNVAIVPAAAWASQDIGAVSIVGASYYSNGVATIQGAGASLYNAPDQFRYTYLSASGDCDITARVASQTNTSASAKAGVMIRASLATNAAFAMAYVTPTSGVSFQYRTNAGGSGSTTTAGLKAPYWVRLVRSGNTFTAYRSPDGSTWTTLSSQTVVMPTAVYIGLPVCSYNTSTPCTATFDHIIANP